MAHKEDTSRSWVARCCLNGNGNQIASLIGKKVPLLKISQRFKDLSNKLKKTIMEWDQGKSDTNAKL